MKRTVGTMDIKPPVILAFQFNCPRCGYHHIIPVEHARTDGDFIDHIACHGCKENLRLAEIPDQDKIDTFDRKKMVISDWQNEIHKNAVDHGWWESSRPIPETLCLIHTEVSEAMEAYRNNDMANFQEEIADIVIRCLDAAEGYGIDLEKEIQIKHEKNKKRPYRHGGKVC